MEVWSSCDAHAINQERYELFLEYSNARGMVWGGAAKSDAITAATTNMWQLGLISSVHIFLETVTPMTVRVADFGVNKVSSKLKTLDESILFLMSSLAIVLKSTLTDDFPTAFCTLPMLCALRGTSTGWRPRKREFFHT